MTWHWWRTEPRRRIAKPEENIFAGEIEAKDSGGGDCFYLATLLGQEKHQVTRQNMAVHLSGGPHEIDVGGWNEGLVEFR